jgi:AcrR family transcriptional regulator
MERANAVKRRRRSAEDARALLLEAARAEIVRGEGDFEIGDVAARAGVSVGLPYHYFGTKSGLIAAVMENFYDRLDAAIVTGIPEEASWSERERIRTSRFVDALLADPIAPYAFGTLAGLPEVAAVGARRLNDVIDAGARNLGQGQKHGAVRTDLEPGILSAALHGAIRQIVQCEFQQRTPVDRTHLHNAIWRLVESWLLPAE